MEERKKRARHQPGTGRAVISEHLRFPKVA